MATSSLATTTDTHEKKRSTLSHLRHELCTPLNAILGYSEMLQEDADPAMPVTLLHGFHALQQMGQQVLGLITGRLDASRVNMSALDVVLNSLRSELRPIIEMLGRRSAELCENCRVLGYVNAFEDLEKITAATQNLSNLLDKLIAQGTLVGRSHASAALYCPIIVKDVNHKAAPCKLLIVDDNESNREILTRQLHREGHKTITVSSGRAALEVLSEQSFDLVLLDVLMPDLNGYEVLKRIKARPELCEIPVIMISALDELEGVIRCLDMGADDYLSKPFDSVLLRVRIGSCLEKKRLRDQLQGQLKTIQHELDIAADIQQSSLPREFPPFPSVKEIDLFAAMIPAREVGGDFYDFFLIGDDCVGLVIGDVSGKGVPAALFMAVTRTLVKSIALTGKAPSDCLEMVNHLLLEENRSFMFVTLFYAILNYRSGELSYCNAGHNPAYQLTRQGRVQTFGTGRSIVLAVTEEPKYKTEFLQLQPGDQLFFYTDGITEACDTNNQLFSDVRLYECLESISGASPEAQIRYITEAVRQFSGSAPQSDDLTMLAISYRA